MLQKEHMGKSGGGGGSASTFAQVVTRLEATLKARAGADPSSSYTAKLLAGGPALAGKKFGEEAVETIIAALSGDKDAIAAESADLIYHWLVLLQAAGVETSAVAEKLAAREGRSGIDEKAGRGK